jgi:hypothetical protein
MANIVLETQQDLSSSCYNPDPGKTKFLSGGRQTHFMKLKLTRIDGTNCKISRYSSTLTPLLLTLLRLKNNIDNMTHQSTWDEYKKITNPYEFIFLSLAKRMQYSVAKKIPLSRSYYKMIEIWHDIGLDKELPDTFVTAHSAEGPGGFIEACIDMAKKSGKTVKHSLAMTLKSTDKNIPGWRKSQAFLLENPNVEITYGDDETGNLYNLKNHEKFEEVLKKRNSQLADLYTADGGFDFTTDFNNQEENVMPLLLAEILLGLKVLRKGGTCIIKLFDTVLKSTLELLYLTTRQFREWTIVKPKTSRAANSERYLICRGYLGTEKEIISLLETALHLGDNQILAGFIDPLSVREKEYNDFEKQVSLIQEELSELQIEAIKKTLSVIENKSTGIVLSEIRENILRSIEWCRQHDVELNEIYKKNGIENDLGKMASEIMNTIQLTSSGPCPSRRYPRELFQQRQKPDVGSPSRSQLSRVAESGAEGSDDHNRALEAWQITEEIRSGNWETVRKQQRVGWKGEP